MRLFQSVVTALLILGLLVGCSGSTEPDDSPSSNEQRVFKGTPAEFTVLMRACFEEGGVKTTVLPDDPLGLSMNQGTLSNEELKVLFEECNSSLGQPKMSGLTEAELQERYVARMAQWECLIEEFLVEGAAPSFEVFVDRYQRAGQKELWEPTFETVTGDDAESYPNPSEVCPSSTDVW